jgi:hypothetical protein
MNRRKFLSGAASAGGLFLLGGGFWARQAYARSRLQRELVRLSAPILANKAAREMPTLPETAREEMRRYFHGACLNVHGFVKEVCTSEFAERLAASGNPRQQRELVLLAFMREVVTEEQVLNRVQIIAEEISHDLDHNWAGCCAELANKWDVSVKEYKTTVAAQELTDRLTPLVESGIRQALDQARALGQRPALGDGIRGLGKSALLTLPLSLETPWQGWPLFAVVALKPVFDFFIARVRDRGSDLQWAVSEKLAALGNRMGLEFENEVRMRIADLHKWQDQAVEEAARQQADQLIRIL